MSDFYCPDCKRHLLTKPHGYACTNCELIYPSEEGYIDFLNDKEFDLYAEGVLRHRILDLLEQIQLLGYDRAIYDLFDSDMHLAIYLTDVKRADYVYHVISSDKSNRFRCLDIGTGMENASELLSGIYRKVFSLQLSKEGIAFQKKKYGNLGISNITIIRADPLKLPFEDNYFDLVVCKGILEWVRTLNKNRSSREAQVSILKEMKRVTSDKGCVCMGANNKYDLTLITRRTDYDRRQAHSFAYYQSLFKLTGFGRIKSYWAFPSCELPIISGGVKDVTGLIGFINFLRTGNVRHKSLLSLLEKMPRALLGSIITLFSPSFIFCCHKQDIPEMVENDITQKATLESYTMVCGGEKLIYFLYNKRGKPAKIASLRREGLGYNFGTAVSSVDTHNRNWSSRNTTDSFQIKEWIPGRRLNPLSFVEAELALEWLIAFQNKTQKAKSDFDVSGETSRAKFSLSQIPQLDNSTHREWLSNYELYLKSLNIRAVPEHGDFFHGNILFNTKSNEITVIDWDYFRECGDPFFDFVLFIVGAMKLPSDSLDDFISNLRGAGTFAPIMRALRTKMNEQLGFELNLLIVMRYALLRFSIRRHLDRRVYDSASFEFDKMLEILNLINQL